MTAGAVDFIEKPFEASTILSRIARAVTIGLTAGRKKAEENKALDELALLTQRERQVFDCLVTGYSTKKAGYELGISPRTIEIHRRVIMRKLNAKSLADLTRLSCTAPAQSARRDQEGKAHGV